jgi:hypothetical protein
MARLVAYATAVTPVVGSLLLAVLAVTQRGAFDAIVREDSVLEWGEVFAYGAVVVVSVHVTQRTRGLVGVAYGLLAVAALGAIGEELSWGQRLFHATTPESVAAANRQQELNVHNLASVESPTRFVLLAAATYGATLPLVRRPGPFVPPRVLVPAFGVVAVYFAIRLALLPEPTYMQAKFSEWPEFCFAAAVALTALSTLSRSAAQAPRPQRKTLPDRRAGGRASAWPQRRSIAVGDTHLASTRSLLATRARDNSWLEPSRVAVRVDGSVHGEPDDHERGGH